MDTPSASTSLTTFTISGRTYELVSFLKKSESYVTGDEMVERAKEFKANLGKEHCQFILEHQDEIPSEYQGKIYLVFPGWRSPSYPPSVACLYWRGDRWCQGWSWLGNDWSKGDRLVRRIE